MRRLLCLTLLALAACNSPSPEFMDGLHREIEVEGSRYSVWRVGDEVEVIRTSPEMLPRLSVVLERAEKAIVLATGCRVRKGSMKGDQSLIKARLACG